MTNNYGTTQSGKPITDATIEELAAEGEQGALTTDELAWADRVLDSAEIRRAS